jgi:hypothetical protein
MSEPERVMRDLLRCGGFSFDEPDPRRASEAFKAFARTPLPDLGTLAVGYECFHVDDRDDVLWLNFAPRFDPDAGVRDCGCLLSRIVPAELRAVNDSWWWSEHGTREESFRVVEQKRMFRACMDLAGWRFAD